jgi:hypothetical protein
MGFQLGRTDRNVYVPPTMGDTRVSIRFLDKTGLVFSSKRQKFLAHNLAILHRVNANF